MLIDLTSSTFFLWKGRLNECIDHENLGVEHITEVWPSGVRTRSTSYDLDRCRELEVRVLGVLDLTMFAKERMFQGF